MDISQLVVRVYTRLVHLYPGRFCAEFGDEMQEVFAQAVDEALAPGNSRALVGLCARELMDLPRALLMQHWLYARSRAGEAAMCGMGSLGERPGLVPLRSGPVGDVIMPAMQRHPAIKRAVDLMFAAFALAVSAPLLLVIAALVRLDSSGPVLFRQQRVGKDGELYTMYKFRSMIPGASKMPRPVGGRDPRLTRVGRVIRTLRLDELPQLYKVLRGEMSVLGPRPALPQE
jgi:hypothetical protein